MAYTAPSTFAAGQVLTAAQMDVLADNDRFFHGPPTVRVRRAATQSIAASTFAGVTFDTEDWDTDTMWSSTASNKIFARTAGKYLCSYTGAFNASTGGTFRVVSFSKNSTVSEAASQAMSGFAQDLVTGANPRNSMSQMISLTTGQFIEVQLFHNVGSNLGTSTAVGNQPTFSMIWMSS